MHKMLPQMLYLVELTDSRNKKGNYNMIDSFINFISNCYVLIVLCVIFVILDFIVAVIFALFNKAYSSTKARQGFLKIFSYFAVKLSVSLFAFILNADWMVSTLCYIIIFIEASSIFETIRNYIPENLYLKITEFLGVFKKGIK